jgi:hypothetical protein
LLQQFLKGLAAEPTVPSGLGATAADLRRVEGLLRGAPPGLKVAELAGPLARLAPLAAVEGVRLVSLQKGRGVEQVQALKGRFSVKDLGEGLDAEGGAFLDTAAVMQNLDLVMTADTAAAHLAGALGVKVWLALSAVADWRWMCGREDTPWYPTMRLYRQRTLGDWANVFERMAEDLRLLVKCGRRDGP